MKKQLLTGTLFAVTLATPIFSNAATVLGFSAGAGTWKHDPGGSITSSVGGSGTSADLKNDLQLGSKSEGYSYFTLEHPVPVLPNLKYVNTKLTSSGSGTASSTFTFNGTTVTGSSAVTTSLKLNQVDTILYYEILDNVVSFDFGLNAKAIDGQAVVNGDTSNFKATIPMLYAAAEVELPAGFGLAAEISTISAGNNKINDSSIKVTYTTDFYLGVEAGVRNQEYTIDVDSVAATMTFKGTYLGVYFKF